MKNALELFKNRDVKGLSSYYENNTIIGSLDTSSLIPSVFKDFKEYKSFMHEFTVKNSIEAVRNSMVKDELVSVYVNFLNVLDELINAWFERVFELFTLYYPEASIKAQDLNTFTKITSIDKNLLSKLFNVDIKSMGLSFEKQDVLLLEQSINTLNSLISQKSDYEKRTIEVTEEIALNTAKVAGAIVAAKLISAAGGLKRLSLMPSSTIQVIGAEKALFRHLRGRKAKPPKHGIIFHSSYISGVDLKHRGKMARALASKISISSKVDYHKGEEIWPKLVKGLDAKLKGLK
ncbi:MAG: hypothetical protein JW791_04020 [Nanoarchaeota archaeon]|nr:hypothetical protein [Nanoarchaeota archaeon]